MLHSAYRMQNADHGLMISVNRPAFTPLRENLGKQVYQHLRDRIYRMEIKPGARLSISEIAEQLGVSRSPVHDALIMLVNEGIAQVNSAGSYSVIHLDRSYIQNAFVVRRALELAAIPLAMEHLDRERIKQLRAQWLSLQKSKHATPQHLEEEILADEELHRTIAEMSQNPLLISALERITSTTWLISRFTYSSAEQVNYGPLSEKEHLRVLNGMLSADVPTAVTALDEHLTNAFARSLERLDSTKKL